MQRIDSAGIAIACEIVGQGPVVLLTHGYASSLHMFRANAAALAEDHTIATWDIRGHGASDAPVDLADFTIELALQDMAAVLDSVGAKRAIVGGHSLGGYLSLAFNVAHPDRVRALILIGTGPGYRSADARDGWNAMALRLASNFERDGFEGYTGGDEFEPDVHVNGPVGLARAARGILSQHDSTVIDSLPTIAVPTLIIVGERDQPFVGGSRYMATKIPDATLIVIPGARHTPNVTHPDEFEVAVRAFLEQLEADVEADVETDRDA